MRARGTWEWTGSEHALSTWIDHEEEQSRLTREALLYVDSIIDYQPVQAWADRLSSDSPMPGQFNGTKLDRGNTAETPSHEQAIL